MELTLKDVHTYSFLVKEGRAEELYLPGMDESENSKLVVPKIDENSKVYFYDISSKTKVYPGVEMIKKIKNFMRYKLDILYCENTTLFFFSYW